MYFLYFISISLILPICPLDHYAVPLVGPSGGVPILSLGGATQHSFLPCRQPTHI